MTTVTTLSVIRSISKPYHAQLDGIGMSKALKGQKITVQVYSQWLQTTQAMLEGIDALTDNNPIPYDLSPYYSSSTAKIDQDMLDMGIQQLPPYDCPEIKNSAMWVVPIYTVLGSRLGASLILKYIEQEQLQLPTHFLREGKQGMRTWRELLANLDRPIEPKSAEQMKTYTEKFWKVIHQRNVQDYATSRRGETE